MHGIFRVRIAVLFIGDVVVFGTALWLSLVIRAGGFPDAELLAKFVYAFGLLFAVWALCFMISGLYENHVLVYPRVHIPRLSTAHSINVLLAALFFFFLPYFGIEPKTILFIYLVISLVFIVVWRLVLFPRLFGLPAQYVLVVGQTPELVEVKRELERTGHFKIEHVGEEALSSPYHLVEEANRCLALRRPDFVIVDTEHPAIVATLPALRKAFFSGMSFICASDAYEDVFGRVPLASISEQWVVKNLYRHEFYDGLKRTLDILVGGVGMICSLLVYPLVALAIKLESKGPVFIVQERVGQYNRPITLYKFRSMEKNDVSFSGDRPLNRVTRVGAILRKSRIDELPQLFNVVRGDLSLIGPRPELPAGVAIYEKAISCYSLRHLVKPGLSGWAQLYHDNHPHHLADIQATKEKLSYDFYYIKHRSLAVDVLIVLKTIGKLSMQTGI